ncbi:MAG: FecR domain-containing protein, partial [Myxococcales bacterium]|nr:FecR domain-containing protein [Myxococcales bacterium]
MTEARWEALIDREAAGESLSAEERAFVADYERAHPECAEERELWQRSLAALGEHRLPDDESLKLISAQALAQHRGEALAAPPRRRSRARSVSRRVLAIALPALAAAAVLAVYWPSAQDSTASLPTKSLTKDLPDSPLRAAPLDLAPTPAEPPRVSPEAVEIHGVLALLEGEPDHTLALGQLVGPGCALAMPTGRICLSWSEPKAVVCADDARVEILDSPVGERRLRLDEGILLADLDPLGPGQRFVVETMLGTVSAVGTVFAVEVRDGEVRALVIEGEVEIADPDPQRLLPGRGRSLRSEVFSAGEEVTAFSELQDHANELAAVAKAISDGSWVDAGQTDAGA